MLNCGHHACFDCRIKWKKEKRLSFGCHVIGCTNIDEEDRCVADYNFDAVHWNNRRYVECVSCAPGCDGPERVRNDSDESGAVSYSSWEI